jgi:hypothetical protein
MHANAMWRWATGAALIGGAVALSGRAAAADHRIWVAVDNTNLNCLNDASGNVILGEARGADGLGNVQCEVMSLGGTASARCSIFATEHQAVIDTRDPSAINLTGTVYAKSPIQTTWSSTSSQISLSQSNTTNCPGGGTIFVESVGQDPATEGPQNQ